MILIMTGVMLLTFLAPFGAYYAVTLAKKKEYKRHRKIQNLVFYISLGGVLLLEGLIRYSGGSGSLAAQSSYAEHDFYINFLIAHIIGAVLTYLLWIFLIITSNVKFQKKLPGKFSNTHKTLGYIVFVGLIYTGATALVIYVMTLDLV